MTIFNIIALSQIVLGVTLVILVLIQQRGGGLGVLGGLNTQFYGTRRGLEKIIFFSTIIIGTLFIFLTILTFLFK